MYMQDEVLPIFKKWIKEISKLVHMSKVKDYGRYFISNHIDPAKAETRGAVYDLFEDIAEYAKMKKIMNAGDMDNSEMVECENMKNIANGIVWAVEHDGFDTVKYDPISAWGKDIKMSHDYMG